ncbi:MAG: RluA family pseudouridine synthase [Candidatus Polarisedimenticolia bacterium]
MHGDLRGTRACRRLDDGTAIYIVGDRDPWVRLDLFLKERIPKLSRERIQAAIRDRVEAPGHGRARPATRLRPGDTVIIRREEPVHEDEPDVSLPLLHLDEHLVVVDKPAGILSHPSRRVARACVTHILARQVEGPLHLVHRLDRETTGVMAVARSAQAARVLSSQMARERAGAVKVYLAVVFGEMRAAPDVIELPLGRASRSAVYVKRGVDPGGRPARTELEALAHGGGVSLVRLRLLTGRRHQIRVHLAALGHPVVGDKLYGPAESHYLRAIAGVFDDRMRRELLTERQLLHAARLELTHPATGERAVFDAPLPADLRGFLEERLGQIPAAACA